MRLSKQGAEFIRKHEGFRSKAYLDPVGILTIGIGFTWRSQAFKDWWATNRIGQSFTINSTITAEEADLCLIYLCDKEYGLAVNKFLGDTKVGQHTYDAMVSMVFNCGPGALKWKWAKAIKDGDLELSARLWKTTATKAQGKELRGLVTRRTDEANLALKGYSGAPEDVTPKETPKDFVPVIPEIKSSWIIIIINFIGSLLTKKV